MRIEFDELASEEVAEAAIWYESQSPNLSDLFLVELQNAVDSIADRPNAWPIVHSGKQVRRKPFHKFPYFLFYKTYENRIVILAVGHQRRRQNYWVERL